MSAEIIDQANELVEHNLAIAIQAARLNHDAVSAETCSECGEAIDERRRIAVPGCKTCASCQPVGLGD
ncbi:TraR/DksA C4-type zinc finger protein [Atlantibacter subterranea]|uniref:TraR/DksA C4-type zinc finger protein n=1 Tax=Atlantibacter subterraneus TaxID=255519 RepID=UPI0020C2CAF0|nr:TraR/DksA C4-type zinc finger protein [Atlantibacter subterranea]UTJ46631.1 TraR/DksA C4-type zinc finger protein [Atlantibacter subterranea]